MSRYNRSNFYPKVIVDNVTLNDFGNSYFNRFFKITRPMSTYTIRYEDIQRPDLISYKLYGDQMYWWLLMQYNEIFDIWNDLYEGQVISVPDVLDFDDFVVLSNKAR